MQDEIAPPFEHWEDRLKDLSDRDIQQLASDYRWLDERADAPEEGREFHRRREAVIAECERRGMPDVAQQCRRPAMGGGAR